MAERRMFAKSIVTSDAFLDMPMSARCLYFTLGMFADDDGFVNSPKSIMRQVGATNDDMSILLVKKFILAFEDGVIVIKHWRINNYLRNDRYVPTKYTDHMNLLKTDDNGAYSFTDTNGIPMVDNGYPQDSIGKNSIDKVSKGKDIYCPAETPHKAEIEEIVNYLNTKAGTSYKASTEATKKHINARLNEGFTVEQFKQVIDSKCSQWLYDNKMKEYLRPETLFGTKFEAYLNKPTTNNKSLYNNDVLFDGL